MNITLLDEHHAIYRISKVDASIAEWRELLIWAAAGQFFSRVRESRLTANERNVLAMLVKGMDDNKL